VQGLTLLRFFTLFPLSLFTFTVGVVVGYINNALDPD
jgi:hypothetical protein